MNNAHHFTSREIKKISKERLNRMELTFLSCRTADEVWNDSFFGSSLDAYDLLDWLIFPQCIQWSETLEEDFWWRIKEHTYWCYHTLQWDDNSRFTIFYSITIRFHVVDWLSLFHHRIHCQNEKQIRPLELNFINGESLVCILFINTFTIIDPFERLLYV